MVAALREAEALLIGAFRLEDGPSSPPDPTRGRALFQEHCATCHGAAGQGTPSAPAPLSPPPARSPRRRPRRRDEPPPRRVRHRAGHRRHEHGALHLPFRTGPLEPGVLRDRPPPQPRSRAPRAPPTPPPSPSPSWPHRPTAGSSTTCIQRASPMPPSPRPRRPARRRSPRHPPPFPARAPRGTRPAAAGCGASPPRPRGGAAPRPPRPLGSRPRRPGPARPRGDLRRRAARRAGPRRPLCPPQRAEPAGSPTPDAFPEAISELLVDTTRADLLASTTRERGLFAHALATAWAFLVECGASLFAAVAARRPRVRTRPSRRPCARPFLVLLLEWLAAPSSSGSFGGVYRLVPWSLASLATAVLSLVVLVTWTRARSSQPARPRLLAPLVLVACAAVAAGRAVHAGQLAGLLPAHALTPHTMLFPLANATWEAICSQAAFFLGGLATLLPSSSPRAREPPP